MKDSIAGDHSQQQRLLFRLEPVPFESPRGYLCRTAHAHGYRSPWWLTELAGIRRGGWEREDRALRLAHVLRLDAPEWLHMCYRPVKGRGRFERRFFLGQVIGANHLNYGHPRACPECLRESAVWWAMWDLKLTTACPIHRCRLIDRCWACHQRLSWHRQAVHECRCGADLRKAKPVAAESNLVIVNTAIFRAAGFRWDDWKTNAQASFPSVVADLGLDGLLRLIQFLGSSQEQGILRRTQARAFAELSRASEIGIAAARLLIDWPLSFRKMLKCKVPKVESVATLNFHEIFGNFYRHLFCALPRTEFGFLHEAFENFVMEDWQGVVRGQHRWFSTAIRKNTAWMAAAEGEELAGIHSQRLGALVRKGDLDGLFVKYGPRTECWIRRNSLVRWIAMRETELSRYMPRPEAIRTLGLKHDTLMSVAQSGTIRYVSGAEKFLLGHGYYFLREDVLRVKHAFESAAVKARPYSNPGEVIALRHALKNYLGRAVGLPSVIRAVVEGKLVPVAYTKRFRGITGYLFRSEELRRYRPVQTEMPPGGFLNYREAARVLGTGTVVVRSLVAHCVFNTPNEYRCGLAKLIPAEDVQRFAAQYVDATILAKSVGETIASVCRYLRQSGTPILDVAIPQKGHKIFLLRKIAAKVKIPPARAQLSILGLKPQA